MLVHRGELRLGLAAGGDLRWAVADVGGPVEEARRRQDLSPLATVALGRALAGAVLLLRFTSKLPGRLSLEVSGDGPLGRIFAEAHREGGRLRGTVQNPRIPHDPGGGLSIAAAVGRGTLVVEREGPQGRWSSKVELQTGEIGQDLVHFLEQSEQIRSAAFLGVLLRPDGVSSAGGFLVEALPGAAEETVAGLEAAVRELRRPSRELDEHGLQGLLDRLLGSVEPETLETHDLEYGCTCERRTVVERLRGLSSDDLEGLFGGLGECEARCGHCGMRYLVHREEL